MLETQNADCQTGEIRVAWNSVLSRAERYAGEIETLCETTGVQQTLLLCGVQSKVVITPGHPVEEIVKAAEQSKIDLIVVGSHGQSALVAAALGSVIYGVLHKDAIIPILVVRR